MNAKKEFRMCVACREMKHKRELLRLMSSDNGPTIDKSFKVKGRGTYICRLKTCADTAKKRKILNKIFKRVVSERFFDVLYDIIEKSGGEAVGRRSGEGEVCG
jgi:predicted RNA-binding protein YlxR (DUF448 family)